MRRVTFSLTVAVFLLGADLRANDCLSRASDDLRSCIASGATADTCQRNYERFVNACGARIIPPPFAPSNFGFPTLLTGQREQWLPAPYRNNFNRGATLYMSFSPPVAGHYERHTFPSAGPFAFDYGHRWDLKRGERQKILLSFRSAVPGTFHARVYLWMVSRLEVQYIGIWDFHGSAVTPPPPPPPPPPPQPPRPSCFDACASTYRGCVSSGSRDCLSRFFSCVGPCNLPINAGGAPARIDFGTIAPRQTRQSAAIQVTNPFKRSIRSATSGNATLYLSWTPAITNDPGRFSPPDLGPFRIVPFQRYEAKGGERKSFAIQFAPSREGLYEGRLWVWWDHRSTVRVQEVFDVRGLASTIHVAPPPGSASPGVTPGQSGGAESLPEWMFDARHAPQLWKGLAGMGRVTRAMADQTRTRKRRALDPRGPAAPPITIQSLMPAQVDGIAAQFREPEAVIIGGSNAVEALAADYIDAEERVQAVGLAFRTHDAAYAHVYAVCARVKGAWVEDVHFARAEVPGSAAGATFWEAVTDARDEEDQPHREYATGFVVYVSKDRRRLTVDSRWLAEDYPPHPDPGGEMLTVQVWSPRAETTAALRNEILARLHQRGTIEYRNEADLPAPEVYYAGADFDAGEATLFVTNRSAADRELTFTAVSWSAANPQSQTVESFTRTLPPGTSSTTIPLRARLNGVIYLGERGSPWRDLAYVADGVWFSFGESGNPDWTAPDCPVMTHGEDDVPIAGCALLVTEIPKDGWRGVGRSLATYTRKGIDVDDESAVSFRALGSELTGEVKVVSEDADGLRYTYASTFTPSADGRQITIPLARFVATIPPMGRKPQNGDRLVEIAWNIAGQPHERTELLIGNVYLTRAVVDAPPPAPSTSDGGPYTITVPLPGGEKTTATLAYRRRDQTAFERVAMTADAEGEQASAQIPAQTAGTVAEFFVESKDDLERMTTSPPDAPYATHAFLVAPQPSLLLADFGDARLRNRRGGIDWTFAGDNSSLRATRTAGTLHLAYALGAGGFAGWVAPFPEPFDASDYDSLALRVRGVRGGELLKMGIADAELDEQKVMITKFVSGGAITTEWQDVRVPLAVFTTVDPTRLRLVLLVFESSIGAPAGAVEVDEIRLIRSGQTALPVENFDDGTRENALGGNIFTSTGGGGTIDARNDAEARFGATGAGYRITATGGTGSWATLGFDLRAADLRPWSHLRFRLRGSRGGERPHVYLVSGPPAVEVRKYVALAPAAAKEWRQYSIPLSDFESQGVDRSFATRLELVWEFGAFADTVELDDIELVP